jgi:hypothetical protein
MCQLIWIGGATLLYNLITDNKQSNFSYLPITNEAGIFWNITACLMLIFGYVILLLLDLNHSEHTNILYPSLTLSLCLYASPFMETLVVSNSSAQLIHLKFYCSYPPYLRPSISTADLVECKRTADVPS